jgi:uncharacterized protein YxjI
MATVLDRTDLVVKHRPKVVELRVGYDVYDPQGTLVASVVQTGRDNLEKTLHPKREDNAQTSLAMSDPSGSVLLLVTHVQALKSSLVVAGPDGAEIGRIRLENLVGKSRFALEVAGSKVGALTAETWRKRSFVLVDGGAAEIARVDMTRGTSGDFSHENDYAVHIAQPLDDPLRSLAVAAVIAVDMILWER